jgi:hypothetical protein
MQGTGGGGMGWQRNRHTPGTCPPGNGKDEMQGTGGGGMGWQGNRHTPGTGPPGNAKDEKQGTWGGGMGWQGNRHTPGTGPPGNAKDEKQGTGGGGMVILDADSEIKAGPERDESSPGGFSGREGTSPGRVNAMGGDDVRSCCLKPSAGEHSTGSTNQFGNCPGCGLSAIIPLENYSFSSSLIPSFSQRMLGEGGRTCPGAQRWEAG